MMSSSYTWDRTRSKRRKLNTKLNSQMGENQIDFLRLLFGANDAENANDEPIFGDENIVTRKNNKIYFYADVNKKTCHRLIQYIDEVNEELSTNDRKYGNKSDYKIFLFINSDGGCVHSALSVIDRILQSEYDIVSIVEGVAASAGTLMSMVCHHRLIQPNAQMLIHELSSACWGKFHEMKEEVDNLEKLHKTLIALYRKYTTLSKRELDKILLHDYMWTAKECKQKGFVDNIKTTHVDKLELPCLDK